MLFELRSIASSTPPAKATAPAPVVSTQLNPKPYVSHEDRNLNAATAIRTQFKKEDCPEPTGVEYSGNRGVIVQCSNGERFVVEGKIALRCSGLSKLGISC